MKTDESQVDRLDVDLVRRGWARLEGMYFPDLTPYEYGRTKRRRNVLNVGWLSSDHPFSTGAQNERLIAALQRLVEFPVNLFRGSHLCEFCPSPPMKLSPGGLRFLDPVPGTTGNGEIRITAGNGVTYVAPVLVLHYVVAHGYSPPQEFVDAAILATPPEPQGGAP